MIVLFGLIVLGIYYNININFEVCILKWVLIFDSGFDSGSRYEMDCDIILDEGDGTWNVCMHGMDRR